MKTVLWLGRVSPHQEELCVVVKGYNIRMVGDHWTRVTIQPKRGTFVRVTSTGEGLRGVWVAPSSCIVSGDHHRWHLRGSSITSLSSCHPPASNYPGVSEDDLGLGKGRER